MDVFFIEREWIYYVRIIILKKNHTTNTRLKLNITLADLLPSTSEMKTEKLETFFCHSLGRGPYRYSYFVYSRLDF